MRSFGTFKQTDDLSIKKNILKLREGPCRQSGTRFPLSPAALLRLTTALQNRVLIGGACKTLPPFGAKGALLRYDLCFAVAANG
ncbi:MAG TPA: hypothetical protein VJK48_07035, partial [Chlamydiales bacterium]|nr:hypothetical protein [Chlamydiales bacterium]